jgi:hypothetical protein
MKASRFVVLPAAMGISIDPALAQQAQPIPTEYHGIWGWGAQECSAKDWRNRDTLHQIKESDIDYWESECRMSTLSRPTDDPEALVIRLKCSGEGEEWDMEEVWKRFDIGGARYLIKVTLGRNEVRLYRSCR